MRGHHHHHHHEGEDVVFRRFGRGFGPGGPRGPRGRGRARRGDVRNGILALLNEQPMHGYQIIQELESRSQGLWRPSPGSIYPALQMFEEAGLISGSEVEGKRVYALTDKGRELLAEKLAEAGGEGAAPWDDVARETPTDVANLRQGIRAIAIAAHQVSAAGSKEQTERALAILNETRRKLYAILAEDPETESGSES
jgi:DNA-binding PadR family transcriptional regulator